MESVVLREVNEDRCLRGLSKLQRSALFHSARWDVVRIHLVCGALGNFRSELLYEDDRKSCSPRQHRRFPRLGRGIHDVSCAAARPARLARQGLASSRLVQCPVLGELLHERWFKQRFSRRGSAILTKRPVEEPEPCVRPAARIDGFINIHF